MLLPHECSVWTTKVVSSKSHMLVCVEVAGMNLPVCPREARLSVSTASGSGHLSNFVGPHRSRIGTEACPWQLTVRPGQKLRLRDIIIPSPSATQPLETCSDVYVIKVRLRTSTDWKF